MGIGVMGKWKDVKMSNGVLRKWENVIWEHCRNGVFLKWKNVMME
jgi:hypothetical protein